MRGEFQRWCGSIVGPQRGSERGIQRGFCVPVSPIPALRGRGRAPIVAGSDLGGRLVGLELKFLGEPEVVRDGVPQSLPPSKKTRALLAYLALNERAFHREHLCSLLWEIPDDPRGSLRWSLSKLRRLVDADEHPRIVADRNQVRFDKSGVAIDLLELRALTHGDLGSAPVAALESAARQYRGHFLEGMELPDFHRFHSWCIAERA